MSGFRWFQEQIGTVRILGGGLGLLPVIVIYPLTTYLKIKGLPMLTFALLPRRTKQGKWRWLRFLHKDSTGYSDIYGEFEIATESSKDD